MRPHDKRKLLAYAAVTGKAGLEGINDLVVPIRDHACAQLPLAAEIAEHSGFRNPRALGDLGARRSVVAFLGEHIAPGLKNVLHALLRLETCRRAAVSG